MKIVSLLIGKLFSKFQILHAKFQTVAQFGDLTEHQHVLKEGLSPQKVYFMYLDIIKPLIIGVISKYIVKLQMEMEYHINHQFLDYSLMATINKSLLTVVVLVNIKIKLLPIPSSMYHTKQIILIPAHLILLI